MKVVLWCLMMFMPLMANASSVNEEQLFHRLDSYIAQRSKFTQRKEAKLLRLKKQLYTTSDKRSQLRLLECLIIVFFCKDTTFISLFTIYSIKKY
jgi:hypothetical protein